MSKAKPKHERMNEREATETNPRAAGRPSSKEKGSTSSVYFSASGRKLFDALPALVGESKTELLENALREYAKSRGIEVENDTAREA